MATLRLVLIRTYRYRIGLGLGLDVVGQLRVRVRFRVRIRHCRTTCRTIATPYQAAFVGILKRCTIFVVAYFCRKRWTIFVGNVGQFLSETLDYLCRTIDTSDELYVGLTVSEHTKKKSKVKWWSQTEKRAHKETEQS